MTVSVVLGAGGAFGWAWHLGVMDAIEESLGVAPTDAERLVGTSAGAAMAIARSSGATTEDLLEVIVQRPDAETIARMQQLRDEAKRPWRWLRPMAPGLLLDPGPLAGARSLVGLLPAGVFPTSPLRRFPAPDAWPANLQVTALSLETGQRVVWGGDEPTVDLHDALEASAAVPMLFEPKLVGGVRHIDGAVASATHADLVASSFSDLVVVSSPMSRPGGRAVIRRRARRQLDDELEPLRGADVTTVVVEPDADTVALAEGYPRTNQEAGPQLVAAARRATHVALDSLGKRANGQSPGRGRG